MAIAYYGDRISPHMTHTPEGFLICHDVPIARTGRQTYLAREIQLDSADPDSTVEVNRYPEDVFSAAAIASFEGKPVTSGHPPENVSPENYAAYTKGHVQNVRRVGDKIVADLYINDACLASEIENKAMREVSCGYLCVYTPDGAGYKQTNIRGNHVAVVPRGRAGHDVAIQDAAQTAEKGLSHMKKETKEAFYRFFGLAANDARPDELEQLAKDMNTVVTALDATPAEQATAAEPAQQQDEPAPKWAQAVLDSLNSLNERIQALETRDAEQAEGSGDEGDPISKAIKDLGGDDGDDKEKADDAAAETVPADEGSSNDGAAKDAAVNLLRRMRPVVAEIEDKAVRAKVTDALLSAVQQKDPMTEISKAAQDAARANAQKTAKSNYEQVCADAESAYAARNPHKTQKEG